jgi:hypothetical protein
VHIEGQKFSFLISRIVSLVHARREATRPTYGSKKAKGGFEEEAGKAQEALMQNSSGFSRGVLIMQTSVAVLPLIREVHRQKKF